MSPRESSTRPTIKDIAKAAGVGVVTVSRALNDKPDVSEATRDRIVALAEEMGYRPNRHARFLKLSHNPAIALLMKGVDNPFFQRMLDTMETRIRERDYLLTVVKVPHWADEFEEAIKLVDEELMAGVIFLGGAFAHDASVFERMRVPFVLSTVSRLDRVPDGLYSSVSVDDELEASRAVRHLIDLGHEKIAVLGVPAFDVSVGAQRVAGYRNALAKAGIPVDEGLIRYEVLDQGNPYTLEHGYRLAQRLLAERPDVTAIFAIADVLAIGAMRAVREAGLRIPEDISIIGFDGITFGDFVEPRLTTLAQPPEQIAKITCDILFDQIDSGPVQHVFVPGSIHEGGSTGPVRAD
ncbi:LacI family DNA-binding transcriptional regulator [Actinomyces culturomici]|uniref:LacI family DNA-binding transcriptional regulator n=1 Tax=Actinomyces culturomici TaxID=1926276 RepID=UPI000E209373|nr:LacI family DNA-binding transcriptional regulator [Actinomyces culturomici]